MKLNRSILKLLFWSTLCGNITVFSLPRSRTLGLGPGEVARSDVQEPTCEELKAMWRFSKRQSRAAELTNEIPTFKDPFSENVWEPYYATTRSLGGMRLGRYRGHPVFGRMVHKPTFHIQDVGEKTRAFEELAHNFGRIQPAEPRRVTAFRVGGAASGFPPKAGKFQHLKELIKTERARELHDQRLAEEEAVRLGHMMSGSNDHRNLYPHMFDMDPNDSSVQSDYPSSGSIIKFPDLLAPRSHEHVSHFVDYSYPRIRSRPPIPASLFGTNPFNQDYDGYYYL